MSSSARQRAVLVVLLMSSAVVRPGHAAEVVVAVATNFLETLRTLEPAFESATGHELTIAAGSTGSLYAQIANGAPYDVFLAADELRPARALEAGLAVAGSDFVYAVGSLVLCAAEPGRVHGPGVLETRFHRLAIANPQTAPYGAAAQAVLGALGLRQALEGRIVQAQSIAGAWSAVATGAADLGFVALSSLRADAAAGRAEGSCWQPPQSLYPPLRQAAVLLDRGAANAGAVAFLEFLRSDGARAAIRRSGYRTG